MLLGDTDIEEALRVFSRNRSNREPSLIAV